MTFRNGGIAHEMSVAIFVAHHPNWDSRLVATFDEILLTQDGKLPLDFRGFAKSYCGVNDDPRLLRFGHGNHMSQEELRQLSEFDG